MKTNGRLFLTALALVLLPFCGHGQGIVQPRIIKPKFDQPIILDPKFDRPHIVAPLILEPKRDVASFDQPVMVQPKIVDPVIIKPVFEDSLIRGEAPKPGRDLVQDFKLNPAKLSAPQSALLREKRRSY